jgi:four helix bundle protein
MNSELPAAPISARTKAFALRVIRVFAALPKTDVARVLGRQMLRSGTSVGANCREAFRSRSEAEFVSKLEIVLQELDETMYWIELLVEAGTIRSARVRSLLDEANEIASILVSSVLTVKRRRRK